MVTYILPSSRLFHMIVCDSVDAHLFVVITRCMYVCVYIYIFMTGVVVCAEENQDGMYHWSSLKVWCCGGGWLLAMSVYSS